MSPQVRQALAIPGRMGGTFTATVAFTWVAAMRRGADVHHLQWDPDPPTEDMGPWACAQVERALVGLDEPLLIAKSLGTYATTIAADRGLAAIWLTPILTSDWVVDGLRRATAPFLLVGGTADPSWRGDLARELTPHVCEVEGADHGFIREGPLADSAAAHGELATAAERFLDQVIWPER